MINFDRSPQDSNRSEGIRRRTVLRTTASIVAGSVLGSSAVSAQQSTLDFGGWFNKTENYTGLVDQTGKSTVKITVGAGDVQGGPYAYAPAAVRISSGTTVTWQWTGKGSSHNVVSTAGEFESKLTSEEGFEFTKTFDEAGVYKYYCTPHKALGMKGVVVVGDVDISKAIATPLSDTGDIKKQDSSGDQSPTIRFDPAELSIRETLLFSLFGLTGFSIMIALLPEISYTVSHAHRPASKTGYLIYRLNQFRNSMAVSVLIGIVAFFVALIGIGVLFIGLWFLGDGTMGFLFGMALAIVLTVWYSISSSR